jgi:hypothetical protein
MLKNPKAFQCTAHSRTLTVYIPIILILQRGIECINFIKGLKTVNTAFFLCLSQHVSIRKGHHQAKYLFKHIKGYRIFW